MSKVPSRAALAKRSAKNHFSEKVPIMQIFPKSDDAHNYLGVGMKWGFKLNYA